MSSGELRYACKGAVMRKGHSVLGIVLLCGLLTACNLQSLMKSLVPADGDKAARGYIEDLHAHRFADIEAHMDASLRASASLDTNLRKVAAFLPASKAKSVTLVGSNTFTMNGVTTYNLTYEYAFPEGWRLAYVQLRKDMGGLVITGMTVKTLPAPLEQINAFTFQGKGPIHLLFFGLAIAFALLTLVSVIACWRTPIPRRKWLWIVFILFGFGKWTLNWTTGAVSFAPVTFILFSAGFTKQFYGPLMLQIAVPVGAVVFWLRRPAWRRAARAAELDMRQPAGRGPAA